MIHVIRASELIGLPVVSIASGEDVAEIRDVIYDSDAHRLIGFTLNKRGMFSGRMKDTLPAESLAAIGADAVMVADEAAITETATPEALDTPGAAKSVIGNRVLSADGNELGEVVGVIIATGATPAAVGYEVDPTDSADNVFVPISEQMALSHDNLLLPADATEFIRGDLAGFGAAVVAYRESTLPGGDR
ncbi:MAG: PRC-barrel domain-containing protein [Acidimicrobiia bacterium]|nr:PRC-barrel domain-containing protein [Acidimicrobiia bacterium]